MSYNGRPGGLVRGREERKMALKKYYKKPRRCIFCEKIIKVPLNTKVADITDRKYCNLKCLGKDRVKIRHKYCLHCGKSIKLKRYRSGKISKAKFCSVKCSKIYYHKPSPIDLMTKEALFKKWGYEKGRKAIRRRAKIAFDRSTLKKECHICGYKRCVIVGHKKPVSKFSRNTKILLINDVKNLVGLCPTHHWELDNGYVRFTRKLYRRV